MTNPKVPYAPTAPYAQQECNVTAYTTDKSVPHWNVSYLVSQSQDLPVFDCPLAALDLSHASYTCNIREMVGHMAACFDADAKHPILLDENGQIMDGRHRIMKALYEGKTSIPAKRFTTNPIPTRYEDNT